VLFAARSRFGAPSTIVSDGGGIFSSNQAMDVYAALWIRKERIDPRQAWQNYVESHFNRARRRVMPGSHGFRALKRCSPFTANGCAITRRRGDFAHEKREDGCHSPAQVLGSHTGTMYPAEFLDRLLFATRYTRHLDTHGFLRFQNWKLYGERGLAKAPVTVWVYEGSLKVEYQAVTLAKYSVELQDDHKHLQAVSHPRVIETPFRSPQLTLIDLGPGEWLLYWKTPDRAPAHRKCRITAILQLPLFDPPPIDLAVGTDGGSVEPPSRTHLQLVPKPTPDQDAEVESTKRPISARRVTSHCCSPDTGRYAVHPRPGELHAPTNRSDLSLFVLLWLSARSAVLAGQEPAQADVFGGERRQVKHGSMHDK
jgi:hypothetical protein